MCINEICGATVLLTIGQRCSKNLIFLKFTADIVYNNRIYVV